MTHPILAQQKRPGESISTRSRIRTTLVRPIKNNQHIIIITITIKTLTWLKRTPHRRAFAFFVFFIFLSNAQRAFPKRDPASCAFHGKYTWKPMGFLHGISWNAFLTWSSTLLDYGLCVIFNQSSMLGLVYVKSVYTLIYTFHNLCKLHCRVIKCHLIVGFYVT